MFILYWSRSKHTSNILKIVLERLYFRLSGSQFSLLFTHFRWSQNLSSWELERVGRLGSGYVPRCRRLSKKNPRLNSVNSSLNTGSGNNQLVVRTGIEPSWMSWIQKLLSRYRVCTGIKMILVRIDKRQMIRYIHRSDATDFFKPFWGLLFWFLFWRWITKQEAYIFT